LFHQMFPNNGQGKMVKNLLPKFVNSTSCYF
jgi:hypothetical protein